MALNRKKGLQLQVESRVVRSSSGAHGRQLKSGVHGGLTLGRTQGGGQYSPRWSLLYLCQILCTCWVTFGLRVVLGVDRIRVVSESNSCNLGLPYNEGSTTRVTHDDLIAAGAQGEPAACAGDQGGRCSGIIWGGAPVVMPRRVGVCRTALTNLGVVIVAVIAWSSVDQLCAYDFCNKLHGIETISQFMNLQHQ